MFNLTSRIRGDQNLVYSYGQAGLVGGADNDGLKRAMPLEGVWDLVATHTMSDRATYSTHSHLGDLPKVVAQGRALWQGVASRDGLAEEPTLSQEAAALGGSYSILRAQRTSTDAPIPKIIEDSPYGIANHALWTARASFRRNIDRGIPYFGNRGRAGGIRHAATFPVLLRYILAERAVRMKSPCITDGNRKRYEKSWWMWGQFFDQRNAPLVTKR